MVEEPIPGELQPHCSKHAETDQMRCRLTSAHQVNDNSSRSHAIMIVHFDTWAAEGTSEAGAAAQAEELFSVLVKAREAHEGATKASSARDLGSFFVQDVHDAVCDTLKGAGIDSQQGESKSAEVERNAQHEQATDVAASQQSEKKPTDVAASQQSERKPTDCINSLGHSSQPSQKRRMRKYGQFILVDLAGSERLKATGTEDATGMSESCAINRSLFALGRVLNAVSETSQGRLRKVCLQVITVHDFRHAMFCVNHKLHGCRFLTEILC